MNFTQPLFLQFGRHYLVSFLKIGVSFIFGVFVSPELFGSFIKISFLSTFFWFLFDFGLKEFALQHPNQRNLNQQKTIHFLMSLPVIIGLFLWIIFTNNLLYWEKIWILTFSISAFISALSIPSYIKIYWDSDIKLLAKVDIIVHGICQPLAIVFLVLDRFNFAFLIAFILPNLLHGFWISMAVKIPFQKPNFRNFFSKAVIFLGFNDFLHQIKQKADTLLLAKLSPIQNVGLYNRGYALPHHTNQFIQAVIQPILVPRLTQKNTINRHIVSIIILGIAVFFMILPPFLEFLIQAFWNSSWFSLIPFIPLFSFWAFLSLIGGIHETLLKGKRQNSWIFMRTLLLSISTLFAIFFFHDDFLLMLNIIVISQASLIFLESLLKIKDLFELDKLTPISEAIAMLTFYFIYL